MTAQTDIKFEAIIFDCDGVLVDSEALGLDESTRYLNSHGLDWTPADLVRQFTGFREDVFADRLTKAYLTVHGRPPPEDFFAGLVTARRRLKDQLQAIDGAHEVLKNISAPVGVASSSRAEFLESKLKRTALWDLVAPHVYSADKVAHGKPAPDIFPLYSRQAQYRSCTHVDH